MDDLIERLQAGCVYRPKRWSGDTHDDLGGPIDEAATESLLAEAAAALSQQRAVPEGWVLVPEKMSKQMREVFHDQIRILCRPDERSATVTNDLALWAAMLAASPEQEK